MSGRGLLALLVYVLAIVAANVMTAWWGLVPVGFGLLVTAGTFAAGFALLARDFVQRYAGLRWVFVGIGVGGLLSWWLASPGLALASVCAFLAAELIDLAVYTALRRRGFITAAALSNVASAPVDTLIFLAIAGFPLTWPVILGQLIGKLVWATAVPLILWAVGHRVFGRRQAVATP